MDLKKAFGKKLRTIRKQREITQEELSEALDLSVVQVSRLECGHHFPSAQHIQLIADVLGVEVQSLFDFKKNQESIVKRSNKEKLISMIKRENSDIVIQIIFGIYIKVSKILKTSKP